MQRIERLSWGYPSMASLLFKLRRAQALGQSTRAAGRRILNKRELNCTNR